MQAMPFHRSLLFWFGAWGLAFLLWAWWDSMAFRSEWRTGFFTVSRLSSEGSKIGYRMTRYGSGGEMSLFEDAAMMGKLSKDITFSRTPGANANACFPCPAYANRRTETEFPIYVCSQARSEGVTHIPALVIVEESRELSYWLVVACYLPPWLGLSAWRARRIAKRDATIAAGD
jgi:hypothetical protein